MPRTFASLIAGILLWCALPLSAADAHPYALLSRGAALVPLRAIFEFLGAKVDYHNGAITATREDTVIRLNMGSIIASRSGTPMHLSAAPRMVDEQTYVPLRFAAEALGARVDYEDPGRAVIVTRGDGERMELVVVEDKGAWRTYRGAWFDIDFPAGFSVINGALSRSMSGGPYFEDATFRSPDGAVELYVFSPQWAENSSWTKAWRGETPGEVTVKRDGPRSVTWGSVIGPNGAYRRSWVETEDEATATNHVFGIQYRDQAAYDRYRGQYLRFKESLVQYAD